MSVAGSQQTSNIQIQTLQFGGITFPPQSTLKVDYVNGRKEGVGIVMSSIKMIIAKLNFHHDKLEGLNMFFDSTGIKTKEGLFVNGVHNGWGREYNDNQVIFEGIYRNGERYSELKKSSTDGYLEEIKDGKTISIFKYNNNHIVEDKGWLFEYDGDKVTAVFECENGEKRIKRIQFDNNEMIELNDNGRVVYRGGFIGNPRDGFVRNGEGNEFDDNDTVVYCGGWDNGNRQGNGLLYDNGSLKYKGKWKEGKPYGKGKLYNSDGEVVMERVWMNEYDDLENGIFRISNTCYVEIDKDKVFVNVLRSGGLFGCSHRWRRYPLSEMNEDEMNDLIGIQKDVNAIESLVDSPHKMDIPEPISPPKPKPIHINPIPELIPPVKPKPEATIKMVIENEDQLRELLKNNDKKRSVKELVIAEGCGNEMKDDLELCGFENLESIVVKKKSLVILNSLKISDNPVLKSIETKDDTEKRTNTAALENVKSVTITGTLIAD